MKTTPGISYTDEQAALRSASQASYTLIPDDHAIIIALTRLGFHQKRIAALYDVNQGRIAEVVRDAKKRNRL